MDGHQEVAGRDPMMIKPLQDSIDTLDTVF